MRTEGLTAPLRHENKRRNENETATSEPAMTRAAPRLIRESLSLASVGAFVWMVWTAAHLAI